MAVAPIFLSGGEIALVDDIDYELVSRHSWRVKRNRGRVYAMKDSQPRLMHRLILNAPDGLMVDHKNGCGLDNRRRNIMVVTAQGNNTNRHYHRAGRSFGVDRMGNKWRARLAGQYIGLFDTQLEAELAYDRAALEKYGTLARFNHPETSGLREVT